MQAVRWLRAHPYVPAVCLAAAGYLVLAPPGHLLGVGGELAHSPGDVAQHAAAALAYVDDSWRWPLFETRRLGWPGGANIIYMDGIPIAGLVFKAVRQLLGVRFQYLGLWFLLVWLGQAAGAVFPPEKPAGEAPFDAARGRDRLSHLADVPHAAPARRPEQPEAHIRPVRTSTCGRAEA